MANPVVNWNFYATQLNASGPVPVEKNCNSVIVINTGLVDLTFNGILIHAGSATSNGESFSIGGHPGEVLNGRLDIAFSAGAGASCVVVQKFYNC